MEVGPRDPAAASAAAAAKSQSSVDSTAFCPDLASSSSFVYF